MREIKFRALDKNYLKWLAPDLVEIVYNKDGSITGLVGNDTVDLLQYTGLKDKNGREIYEGDVVGYKKYSDMIDVLRPNFSKKDADRAYRSLGEEPSDEEYEMWLKKYYEQAPLTAILYIAYNIDQAEFGIYCLVINDDGLNDYDDEWEDDRDIDDTKVIGNIYRNPELLKFKPSKGDK